jgi:hypothetical protein
MSRIASFVLPATADRTDVLGKLVRFAHALGSGNRWRVTIEPYKPDGKANKRPAE